MAGRAKKALTDAQVRACKATGKNYRIRDGAVPGLALEVTRSGTRTWQYWFISPEPSGPEGKRHRRRPYTIGRYPDTSLADAREAVPALRGLVGKHVDPIEENVRQAAQRVQEQSGSLKALMKLYREKLESEGSTAFADKIGDDFDRNVTPTAQALPAADITEDHVIEWMEGIVGRAQMRGYTGGRSADYLRTYIRAAFEFALTARSGKWKTKAKPFAHLVVNPAQRIQKFQQEPSVSHRNLSPDELKTLWSSIGVDALSDDMALYIKLAFALGGQRVEELLHARWNEFNIDGSMWAIPIERRKIRKKARHREPHLVPLTPTAIRLLAQLQELTGGTDYLFPDRTNEAPRKSTALDQAIRRYCTPGKQSKRESFEHFTPRDIRRTVKTLMGVAGISKEYRDRIQGHAFQDVGSVHYDRYDYLPEKKAAMKTWTRWLRKTTGGAK